MPRGKKIVIETEIEDEFVDRYRTIDLDSIRKKRNTVEVIV